MGKIVSFANQKGGVGKTTTCINLASYLSALGKKILVIDMDPQGNATSGLGITKGQNIITLYDAIDGDKDITEVVRQTNLKNLDIIPATVDLAGAEVKNFACPIDAKVVDMTAAKFKKLPAHIGADYLTLEKSTVEKLNSDIRVNTLNIKSTKVDALPKDMRVNRLIVDSKVAKNISLLAMKQAADVEIDGYNYAQVSSVESFNFCSVNAEARVEDCSCAC